MKPKCFLLLLFLPIFAFVASAQKPAEETLWARSMGGLHKQLAGECYFDVPCHVYFVEACREFGLPKASLIAMDRRLRCSRIGMAGLNGTFLDENGHLHESLDAYRYRKTKPFDTPVASLQLDYNSVLTANQTDGESQAFAQSDSISKYISEDYDFANYLLSLNLRSDLDYLLHASSHYQASDTLYFLQAWSEYLQQQLPQAVAHFSLIDSSSVFWEKSLFHQVALLAHLGCYQQAEERLNDYMADEHEQLKHLQLAGLALLRNDMSAYQQQAAAFDLQQAHYLRSEQLSLQTMFEERQALARKNPYLAATLSAVLPGAGKIYAGNLSEGVMSFVITGALAAITAEHWVKKGPQDWRSITFASLTGLSYISNVFGSYFSVQILQDHVLQKQTQAILYHIHLPLDRLFR